MARKTKPKQKMTELEFSVMMMDSSIDTVINESKAIEDMYKRFELSGNKKDADLIRMLLESIDCLRDDFKSVVSEIEHIEPIKELVL